MQELIDAIKAWPVIVQGALGSALFWLVLLLGQRATSAMTKKYSHMSKAERLSWLISAQTKYEGAISQTDIQHVHSVTTLVYRSMRHLLRALMWLALGLIIDSIVGPLGVVGLVGCLYYLFKAYEVVSPITEDEDPAARLEQIRAEIAKLLQT